MSKSIRYLLAGCLLVVLLLGTFSGGLLVGWLIPDNMLNTARLPQPAVLSEQPGTTEPPQDTDALFAPFWETWELVHGNYVDQPIDDTALMRGAIRGMLEALGDQHTSYMDPDQFRQANLPMDGEYEGIGAYVDITGEYLVITSPMPNSPAEKAGLRPGDVIIAVDGDDMTGVDGNLVLRRVLGPANTQVILTIAREGVEPFDVSITRAKIVINSVEGEMLEDNIAYVKISTYGDKTTSELNNTLKSLMDQKPSGMIVDLRNNGGGYLNTAIEVVSQFIPEGVVMYEEYGDGKRDTFTAKRNGLATQVPLVVLVNGGTASASEITAGAIQDVGRGTLVGTTTFGKGSVQNWIPLNDDGGAVRITVARWLTPNGRQIHQIGLEPDFVVELTEEDFDAGRDPQLEKAVEILTQNN
jgi:carboxyl-terminal processing protease